MTVRSLPFRIPLLSLVRGLAPAVLLLLGACASVGDYGAPGPGDVPAPAARQELAGQVRNVDHGNRRFLLERDAGGTADIAYDDRTRLVFQGRERDVAGLEPGDRVRLLASREGALWYAQDVEVLQDVRGGGSGTGLEERSGAIAFVDPGSRTIGYTSGGYTGGEEQVRYDRDTLVEYRGERYPPDALERGDLVRLQLRRGEQGWVAVRIVVETSVRDR